jgi:hypothetical protein
MAIGTEEEGVKRYEFARNGGLASNQTAHTGDDDARSESFLAYLDLINDVAGRRRKRQGTGTAIGANAGSEITAIHEFLFTNETTGVETLYKFRAFGAKIQKLVGAVWTDMVLPTGYVLTSSRWTFKNFNNCCLATNGADHALKFDTSTGPVDGREWYYIGADAPAVAPGYQPLSNTEYSTGAMSVTNGSPTVSAAPPSLWNNTDFPGKWIDIGGVRYQLNTVAFFGTAAIAGTVSVVNGNVNVVGVGTAFVAGLIVGQVIQVAGVNGTIASITNNLNLVLTQPWAGATLGGQVCAAGAVGTLTTGYAGATASGLTYKVFQGIMDWAEGPRYAIGYKSSRTGHVSNIGPVLQVTEKDQVGRTITLSAIPYGAAQHQNGFDLIQIYRSAKNGFNLCALGTTIPNANSGGTTTFTELTSTYLDNQLTTQEAPLTLNARPVDQSTGASLAFIALGEWAGRLFGLSAKAARIFWCGAPEEIPYGRPEECWAQKYNIRCNAGRGLLELGTGDDIDQLLVQTSLGDRILVGYDPLSFQLRKVKTRKAEGFQGGSISVDGDLVSLQKDKRFFDYASGKDLGRDIQDKLNACNPLTLTAKARAFWFSYKSKDYILVSVPKTGASSVNDGTFVYDRDLDCWYEWSIGFSAFALTHNATTGDLELWAGTPAGDVFNLLTDTWLDGAAHIIPQLSTSWLRPFGENGRANIQWIEIFTTEAGAFSGSLFLDEEPNLTDPDARGTTFTFTAAETRLRTAKSKHLIWKPARNYAFNAARVAIVCPDTTTDLQIEKMIIVTKNVSEVAAP